MKSVNDTATSSQWTCNFGGSVAILKMSLEGNPIHYHCESQNLGTRTALFITEKFFKELAKR